MTVLDEIRSLVDDPESLQRLEPLLSRLVDTPSEDINDANGDPWRVWNTEVGQGQPLTIIPASSSIGSGGSSDNILVIPDPAVDVRVALSLDAIGGEATGDIRLTINTPGLIFRPPVLRPAKMDERGQLRPDTSKNHVEFHLPRVRIRIERPADGAFSTRLLGAATDPDDPGPERLYEFIRMEPAYALVGPDATFGFAFRSAVLDMSETDTPASPSSDAITMPDEWQGLWLPEVRIFVAPEGLQGVAVSAGVRDLYIGIGESSGLSGEFKVEIVNRGGTPTIGLRIHTPNGELIPIAPDATTVEAPSGSTIVADANGGLAPHGYQLVVGGAAPTASDRAALGSLATAVSVNASVTDAASNSATRAITVSLRTSARPGDGAAAPTTNPATIEQLSDQQREIRIVRQTASEVIVHAAAAHGELTWTTLAGTETTTADGELSIQVTAGASGVAVSVEEQLLLGGDTISEDCYFTFDSPRANETATREALETFHSNSSNMSRQAQLGTHGSLIAPFFRESAADRFALYPGASWTIEAFASYEGKPEKRAHNQALSERRLDALLAMLADLGIVNVVRGSAHGHDRAVVPAAGEPPSGSGEWRRASASTTATATLTGRATLRRPATPPTTAEIDQIPPDTGRPDCFRKIGVRVRIENDIFTRLEIYGEFDIETAVEGQLPPSSNSLPANPTDGIVSFLLGLKLAPDRSSWEVRGEFRGDNDDVDGLARWADSNGTDTALNIIGGIATMAPLMALSTPPTADGADLVPMVLIGATAGALGAANVLKTHSLILRGVELVVADTLIDATKPTGPTRKSITLLLDIETRLSFDAGIIEIDPSKPVTTRYKAIGVRAGWDEVDDGSGGTNYVPIPMFDASRGYTLDLPAGSMSAKPPLDQLLRILGVQVSRSNPTYLEVEVAMGIDLGIISVDSARVRVLLDIPTNIEITKLGASIEIPGTLHGKGWVSIDEHGFSGALDITLTSINLRAAATITVHTHPTDGYTGVLVGAEVEFPVPLVLGSSGLGIFGFSGGVAINYTRNSGTEPTAALEWVHSQLGKGSVMHPDGWTLDSETLAIAAGMLVGTLEGGYLIHLKGMLLLEVPGPRLLLIMKADVISAPPALGSTQSATFLAVLDLDFARGTITVAIVAEYDIKQILHIRVPVTAFFPTKGDTRNWFIDLGAFDDPISVSILEVFEGTGYLMIHGAGLDHPVLGNTTGLTIATGFHLRAILMGSKSIGLYLEATAGFDAMMAFEPMFLAGRIYVSGELRLFIISIGASAELQVRVGQENLDSPDQTHYIFGKVCGKVDFFFFSIKGCVSLEIGHKPALPPAPDLVTGVSLLGRGPAIVEGDGAERIIDGKLGIAVTGNGSSVAPADRLEVPIDAIPVIAFTATPLLKPGARVLGKEPDSSSSAEFTGGWVKRGDLWVRYRITGITLLEGTTIFDPDGQSVPCSWLSQNPPDPSLVDSLSLLSWVPNPTPHALPYGETLLEGLRREWDVCTPAPPPAESLWTFNNQALGADPEGWRLRNVAWPDPADIQQFRRSRIDIAVSEPWRTGHPVADLLGPSAGRIVGDAVPCTAGQAIQPSVEVWWDGNQPSRLVGFEHPQGQSDLADALLSGFSLHDAAAELARTGWDPQINPETGGCEGRILEAPLGRDDRPPAVGPAADLELVDTVWQESGHIPNKLRNAIRFTLTAALTRSSVLLLVPIRELSKQSLIIRRMGSDGAELEQVSVTDAERLGAGATMPATWWDPELGPWADLVRRAGMVAARIAGTFESLDKNMYDLAFVQLSDVGKTGIIDIGWDRSFEPAALPFFVVALSGLPLAEIERHKRQSDYLAERRKVIETTLEQDPSDHALLNPGQSYTVSVAWESQTREQDDIPADDDDSWAAGESQGYTFWTSPQDENPSDLSPWLMATVPTTGEQGVLCRQAIRLALSTQNVTRLFAAHGRTLQIRVRAASGSHPPPPGGQPDDLVLIPLETGGIRRLLSTDFQVTSAFHTALREIAEKLPCVDPGPPPEREEIIIPYDFDPLTEYLIDVFAVPIGVTTVTDADRIHRISFKTSRFDTAVQLADLVRFGPSEDIVVTDATALDGLPEHPSGPELDEAFLQAGLDAPTVPRFPSSQVVWGLRGTVLEPIALIIESSETLWRSRDLPVEQVADADSEDPSHKWWVRSPVDWMTVETGGDAAVRRLVRGPGDSRVVVLLEPGQRGRILNVDLVQPSNQFWRASDDPNDGNEQRASMGSYLLDTPIWEVVV